MKRIVLFLATNIAVMLVLTVVVNMFGLGQFLAADGLNVGMLLAFSAVMGFAGSIISLLMSKPMAKWSMGLTMIEAPSTADEQWLVATVKRFADKAGIGMPEVGIFEGAPNAFATGAFKNSSLVAVSTGLLQSMTKEEVEAVIGHEVAHVANGDMVTLALIQGVVNTFVVFLSRIVGYLVDKAIFRTERGTGPGYFITVIVCQILFGILAAMIVAWFSRQREFRADAGSADLTGNGRPMVAALRRLGGLEPGELAQSVKTFGINSRPSSWLGLFSSHPPIEERIAALEARRP